MGSPIRSSIDTASRVVKLDSSETGIRKRPSLVEIGYYWWMKFLNVIKTWLLALALILVASGYASAKVASGGINLSSGASQGIGVAKSLSALGIAEVSTMFALDSPLAAEGAENTVNIELTYKKNPKHNQEKFNTEVNNQKEGLESQTAGEIKQNIENYRAEGRTKACLLYTSPSPRDRG